MAIGFFPSLYPDELLYSLCARYSDRVQYPSPLSVNTELFGSNRCGTIGLPIRLNHFISALPTNQPYSVDDFIANNTLLPLYVPFFPTSRLDRLLKVMKGSDDAVKQSLSGTFNSSIKGSNCLRFCPVCMEADDNNYGERYWHRLHQVPGVEVCPIHLVFLECSEATSYSQSNIQRHVSAKNISSVLIPKRLNTSNKTHQALLRLAQDAQWLLGQRDMVFSSRSLHACYMKILREQNLTNNFSVKVGKLQEEFQAFYPSQLLRLLQSQRVKWLSDFLPYLKRDLSAHPLRHLLLIQFLGYTAELFFNRCKLEEPFRLASLKNPFGEGPWFCLNPTCESFRKRIIKECHITYSHQRKTYYGTFRCTCGFTYISRLPLTSDEDQLRVGKVKDYGHVWESALKEFWHNPDFTLRDIALELGVYHKTVKYQALRLGLSFPRLGPSFPLIQVSPKHQQRVERDQSAMLNKLKTFRSKWLNNLISNKGESRSSLRRRLIYVHYWLNRHDRDWLETHMPPAQKNNGAGPLLDWKKIDIKLAKEVRRITLQLMNTPGRPIRVTKSAIFRDRKRYKWLFNRKTASKLPLTLKALADVVETRVQFSLRRIQWAVDCFIQEGIVPSFSQLTVRAGVINSISLPKVNSALETALLRLQRLSNTDNTKVA
jgi:hypothetical protein